VSETVALGAIAAILAGVFAIVAIVLRFGLAA
jgi:MFS superfamily sulfate permease-like transporter